MLTQISIAILALATSSAFARTTNPPVHKGDSPQNVILDTCFSPNEGCDDKLVAFLNQATESIDMAIYDLTLPSVAKSIEDAQARGVKVRIVADRRSSSTKMSQITAMKSNGIDIKLWGGATPGTPGLMHNKFTVIDGHLLETGSYNYSSSATHRNAENQIYINDADTVAKYMTHFEQLWSQLSN
jgi:phosphatidylserine/phosphatidylglycerophosphate/cardiolipin synthase-like enzyme